MGFQKEGFDQGGRPLEIVETISGQAVSLINMLA